jgi:L-threonylcarbamoyladenylate synthase
VANAYNSEAIAKIYQYKNRPADKPLAWLLHSIKQVEELFIVNETFYQLAEKFLPGGLTLILNTKDGAQKQGFRIPNNKVCLNLLEKLNVPLASTSSNISSQKSAITASEVRESFADKDLLILDDDKNIGGIESTVLDITEENNIVISRHGAISLEELHSVIPAKAGIH